jgi:hypothetical protein
LHDDVQRHYAELRERRHRVRTPVSVTDRPSSKVALIVVIAPIVAILAITLLLYFSSSG